MHANKIFIVVLSTGAGTRGVGIAGALDRHAATPPLTEKISKNTINPDQETDPVTCLASMIAMNKMA